MTTEVEIHTYHCICTHLLLATTLSLATLPRRSLDNATILPFFGSTEFGGSGSGSLTGGAGSGGDSRLGGGGSGGGGDEEEKESGGAGESGSNAADVDRQTNRRKTPRTLFKAIHAGTAVAPQPSQPPLIVRREDGYEKRWLVRCERCECVVGYQLAWEQWDNLEVEVEGQRKVGRREDVAYLLEGAVVETDDMLKG